MLSQSKDHWCGIVLVLVLCWPLQTLASSAPPRKPVVLQLKWSHQYQFAGYYVALEKGYYHDAGLDVEIRPGGSGQPAPVESVLSGEADFGLEDAGLARTSLDGFPVVALAAIFQHSPLTWLVRADSGIYTLHDLVGKRLMLKPPLDTSRNAELLQPFRAEGIALASLRLIPTSYDVHSLISGETDAFNGYMTNEPYLLEQQGIAYRIISPRAYGVDFYGDVLFTSAQRLRQSPQMVEAFRQASLKGWRYAMENIEEVAVMVRQRYAPHKSLEHLLFEAEAMRRLIRPELIEIGHMNPDRWRYITQALMDEPHPASIPDLDRFLYRPRTSPDLTRVYLTLGGALLAVALMTVGLIWFYRINRRLRREVRRRMQAERKLRRLSQVDELTGLYNRRHWHQQMTAEFSRFQRHGHGFSLAMIDVDWFKQVNDNYGHQAGDLVLVELARLLCRHVRRTDRLARIGGEEFVLILPDTLLASAAMDAQRLRRLIESTPIELTDGQTLSISVSIGVACVQVQDPSEDACVTRADKALYRAKAKGRNRVEQEPEPAAQPP